MTTKQQMLNRLTLLHALESGNWKQTRGTLHRLVKTPKRKYYAFCCLGVAEACRTDGGLISGGMLTPAGQRWLGVTLANPLIRGSNGLRVDATTLNDHYGKTFKQIAKLWRPALMCHDYNGWNP